MAYIGTDINYGNLATQEGTGDGSDVTPITTLDYTVPSSASIMVTLDGVTQVPGVGKDFTASGTTLTFTTAPANLVKILVYFLGRSLDIGTPADNTVTSAKIVNGTIVNDDVNASAAIATSKLSGAVTSIPSHGLGALASLATVGTTQIDNDSVTGAKLNPALVAGDIIYADGTDTINRLAKPGTPANEVLTFATSATAPSWVAAAGGGKIVQVVNVQDATTGSGTTTVPSDDTIPQVGETNLFLELNITPTSTSNKLYIVANVNVVFGGADSYTLIALFNDDTHATNALAVNYLSHHINYRQQLFLQHYMTSGFDSEITFKIGAATLASGTTYYNSHTTGARVYGGVMFSEMTIMEIAV